MAGHAANQYVFMRKLILSSLYSFVQKLNEMGAKRIGFVGLPPIGCCPSQRTLGGGPPQECEPLRNQASELFNSKITKEIDRLNVERNVDGSKFAYFDVYYNLLDLIQQPGFYGKSTLCLQLLFYHIDATKTFLQISFRKIIFFSVLLEKIMNELK